MGYWLEDGCSGRLRSHEMQMHALQSAEDGTSAAARVHVDPVLTVVVVGHPVGLMHKARCIAAWILGYRLSNYVHEPTAKWETAWTCLHALERTRGKRRTATLRARTK